MQIAPWQQLLKGTNVFVVWTLKLGQWNATAANRFTGNLNNRPTATMLVMDIVSPGMIAAGVVAIDWARSLEGLIEGESDQFTMSNNSSRSRPRKTDHCPEGAAATQRHSPAWCSCGVPGKKKDSGLGHCVLSIASSH
jgi:hypothetical protein